MALSEVPGNFSLPALALEHQNPTAITLVDVIVFERIPGNQAHDDLHYWSHELFHVQQYRRYGVADFTRRYLSESLKDDNALELAADEYACGFYPCGAAAYLPGGVCRNRPPNCP
jgi:hypothetical protein